MDSDSDEFCEMPQITDKPRKKILNKAGWKKNVLKQLKYDAKAAIKPSKSCNHSKEFCAAATLSNDDIKHFNAAYWKNKDATSQKSFLLNYIEVKEPQRRRPNQGRSQHSEKSFTSVYQIQTKTGPVNVCQKSFLSILNVGRKKVENAAREKKNFFCAQPEKRGGARIKTTVQKLKEKVIAHIKKFKCRDKHYGRRNAPLRKYLPSELNIMRMWKMFCEEERQSTDPNYYINNCSYEFYDKIFNTKFNLGFGSVKQDTCNDCMWYKTKIKAASGYDTKQVLKAKRYAHKQEAGTFFKHLNNKPPAPPALPNSITLNWDVMQNQPLPKCQINQAYYSRQIWYYVFAIVIHLKTKKINTETVHFYRWCESDGGKGPNEISSCIWDFFAKILRPMCVTENIDTLRMFNDSCGGQNKNYTLMCMFAAIASQFDLKVEWFFPVRGHSYMPADRAFGIVEKKLMDETVLLVPEKYDEIVRSVGTLHIYGIDFPWMNWQDLSNTSTVSKKTFKISSAKQIVIKPQSALIGVRKTYKRPVCKHTLLKRGRQYRDIVLSVCETGPKNHVNESKKSDVIKLLDCMGYDANRIPFYENACKL